MATKTSNETPTTELFDSALKAFGETLKAGVRVQEEVTRWWADALGPRGQAQQDWQKRTRSAMEGAIPAAQKNAEEWLRLVEENYRRSIDLLRKAMQTNGNAGQAISAADDAAERTQDLWQASVNVVRENLATMAQANLKMLELWSGMIQNTNGAGAPATRVASGKNK